MARIYKKYGIYGMSEYVALVGNMRIAFKGGYNGTRGISPASYTTASEQEQSMIECSDKWNKGIIVLVDQWQEEEDEQPVAVEVSENTDTDPNTYPAVTNMQAAIKILSAAPYNAPLSELQNKDAVKKAAAKRGVNFPNWK